MLHGTRNCLIHARDGILVEEVMNVDELEDYRDLHDTGLKKQIRKSQEQYRNGKARDAAAFLASLRHTPDIRMRKIDMPERRKRSKHN